MFRSTQWYNAAAVLHVRGVAGGGTAAAQAARSALRELAPSLAIPAFRPFAEALAVVLFPQRLAAWVAACMGTFGLILAAVGIYGVTAVVMSRNSREMAIRVALGATRSQVVRLMATRGAVAPAVGLAVGLLLAAGFSVGASHVVPGVRPADPLALLLALFAIGLVVTLAMLQPMHKQLRRPPMSVLHED